MRRKGLVTLLVALVMALGLSGAMVAYATGGGTPLADDGAAPAAISLTEHENKYYALPNGKGWSELKTAYENALNTINQEIKAINDENGDLAQAVKDGRIPFYSKENDGYITEANLEGGYKYGEKWLNQNVAQDALPVYRLTEGFSPTAREPQAALVVFNAKATDTTGVNGVVFVTGEFAVKWSGAKGNLGLANGNTFTVGNTTYQNFQRGYLKKSGESDVELIRYKNVDSEGKEQAADLNALGWFGASGHVDGDKNKIEAENEEEVKAFAAMASAYYDELRASGYNPGYPNNNEVFFGNDSIRDKSTFPLTNFYHGDSSAVLYGDANRANWSTIGYNKTLKKMFTLKDEIIVAMEGNDNFAGSLEIGAPASEMFAVKAFTKRYQDFDNGYIEVSGLIPQNSKDGVTVHKNTDAGYKPLKEMLAEEFAAFKNGDAKTAYDNERTYTAETYAAFKTEYEKALGSNAGVEETAEAYNALYDSYTALEISDPTTVLAAAKDRINAISSNNDKTYTGLSYTAFTAAKTSALALPETTNEEKFDKIDAINAALALLVKFEDIIPNVTVSQNSAKFIASANGKGWEEMKVAFENALNEINKQVAYVLDGRTYDDSVADLDEAVASGTIPFYSTNNGGYLKSGNFDAFGEKWMSENAKQNAFVVYSLNDGVDSKASGTNWFRDKYGALMVFNAKATDVTGTNGVIFVTSNFVAAWDQRTLGMPNANAFTVNGVKYQNFQRGYLKAENGNVSVVRYKNIEDNAGEAKEVAANSNVSGWFGAMGMPDTDYKNTLGFTTEAEVKAFTAAASAYYDSLIASGYNPGYSNSDVKDSIVFGGKQIRNSEFKADHLYHGDSAAMPWGDENDGRSFWTSIAYNAETKEFFMIRDEILFAMEKGTDDNGNYKNILALGAPTSEMFSVKTTRYQLFTNGYVSVDGLTAKNGCAGVNVFNKNDDNYRELTDVLEEEYNSFYNGEAKTAYDAGASAFASGYAEFKAAYDAAPKTAPTDFAELDAAFEALYGAYAKLITPEVKAAYDEALGAVEQIVDNGDYKYSAASFEEFEKGKAAAVAMISDTQDEMIAKTEALNAALELLVETKTEYEAAKAQIEAVVNGNNADKKYTDSSWTAFTEKYNSVQTPSETDYKGMYDAAIVYEEALELLVDRLEGVVTSPDKTIVIGEDYTVTATGDSNGAITVEIVSGDAVTLSGNVITAVKAGVVTLKITMAGGDGYFDATTTVTVTVDKKAAPSAPAVPVIENVTADSITVKAVEGAEYRLGATGEWQKSNVFTSLTANTEYTVYIRYAETDTQYASGAVSAKATTQEGGEEGCGCGSFGAAEVLPVAAVLVVLACAMLVVRKRKEVK